jgi:hypothetical protein
VVGSARAIADADNAAEEVEEESREEEEERRNAPRHV